jgi:hypothetical protein
VLLTHPRNLTEPAVHTAARAVPAGTRLFALTVDAEGAVQLAEMRRGEPTVLRRGRISFATAHDAPPRTPAVEAPGAWKGDTEPVGFPFRFGIAGRVGGLAFEYGGRWLVALGTNGMLHACEIDTGKTEVLPRPYTPANGGRLRKAEKLIGVAGGFVAAGVQGGQLFAAHYDLAARTVTVHELGPGTPGSNWAWQYHADLHCVTAREPGASGSPTVYAVDLGTGGRAASPSATEITSRAVAARARAVLSRRPPPPELALVDKPQPPDAEPPWLEHDEESGALRLGLTHVNVRGTPKSDGKPVLQKVRVYLAQYAGSTLALCYQSVKDWKYVVRLLDSRGLTPMAEFPFSRGLFLLSPDGRRLARQTDACEVTVTDASDGAGPVTVMTGGRFHHSPRVRLGADWLSVQVGNRAHLLRWDGPALTVATPSPSRLPTDGMTARTYAHLILDYDRHRFAAHAESLPLTVFVDAYGQLAVFDAPARRLIAMFFCWRERVAAWMPDGTRFGPEELTGGPATPNALETLGRALRAAGRE